MADRPIDLELVIAYSHAESGWLTASIPAMPSATTAGRTRDEARADVLDALALVLSSPEPERVAEADELERVRVRIDFGRAAERSIGR
jgi:predicted RNase H-like HicB family nuclease